MKLFLLTQDVVKDFDTYDSVVVSAENENDARNIHPSEFVTHITNGKWHGTYSDGGEYIKESSDWVECSEIHRINVEYLGETHKERGVILASFNAG